MNLSLTGRANPAEVLVMVLAGGEGQRLYPLTRRRAKPAVRYGAAYRMIDFTLSNAINSGYRRVYLLTQFAASPLQAHIRRGWVHMLCDELGEFIDILSAQRMAGDRWYAGTADAIFQNLFILNEERPRLTLILSGDHAYKMDYRTMVTRHDAFGAALTIATLRLPRQECCQLGVLEVDEQWRVVGFEEKPADPKPIPGDPDYSLVSMGVYVWNTVELAHRVADDARMETHHDFGHDIIPTMVEQGAAVFAHLFDKGPSGEAAYWRDIGTLDAYWKTNMELVSVVPELNLYDPAWPIHTYRDLAPPAKTVHGAQCVVYDSLLAAGCIISGASINRCVLSPNCYIHQAAELNECILMDGVEVGRNVRLNRVIVDDMVHIPNGFTAGFDREADAQRFVVSEDGVTVIPQGIIIE